MARGRRKVEDGATARRILAAAERQFAAQGMAGARTDEIAAAAHANKAMLYYYFGDKRRLHRAVLENLFRQLRKGVFGTPRRKDSPSLEVKELVTSYFDFLASHPNYPRLVHREAMEHTKNFDWIVRGYLQPFHKRMVCAIQDGIKAGEIRGVDPHDAAFTLMGMTTSYFAAAPILSEIAGRDLLSPAAVARRKSALLDFIEHGLEKRKARSR
ncbi:MAG TPA: TetR family transcriptional regulator [Candidatus Acidoferrum sp.]|nr:TetR family transcriptional regulator [Candidatus Acidoferrum sp.]